MDWRSSLSIEDLRAVATNRVVLALVEGGSAHGDLSEVLVAYGAERRLELIDVGDGAECGAMVAARPSGEIVAFALGMQRLVLRVGSPPSGARLAHEPAHDVGSDWWRLNPFDADVGSPDTAAEMRVWFAAIPSS